VNLRATGLVLVALLLGGCGDKGNAKPSGAGPLTWVEPPYVGTPSKLIPDDHVVLGEVRNDSLRRVKVHFKDVRLLEADGDTVPSAVRFTDTPGHGLYPPTREPDSVKPAEDLRIGRAIKLEPGKSVPLVVSWRGDAKPVAVDYRSGRLVIPGT
jgi:hypothetical protein